MRPNDRSRYAASLQDRDGLMKKHQFTAVIEREGKGYVSFCPELDVASQGQSIEEARQGLQEAIELFLESASPSEVKKRLHTEVLVTRLEVAVG
jgi:predicted RNase H-like HicB family nuclease